LRGGLLYADHCNRGPHQNAAYLYDSRAKQSFCTPGRAGSEWMFFFGSPPMATPPPGGRRRYCVVAFCARARVRVLVQEVKPPSKLEVHTPRGTWGRTRVSQHLELVAEIPHVPELRCAWSSFWNFGPANRAGFWRRTRRFWPIPDTISIWTTVDAVQIITRQFPTSKN